LPRPTHRVIPNSSEKSRKTAQIYEELKQIVEAGTPKTYLKDRKRTLARWSDFCNIVDQDPDLFGKIGNPTADQLHQIILYEGEILSSFLAFIRIQPANPRSEQTVRSISASRAYLSAISEYYHEVNGRYPGRWQSGKYTWQLQRALAGIKLVAPKPKMRLPVMQQDLRKVKAQLNLQTDAWHRVLWAFWLTQWQGGLRPGDLIRSANEAQRKWNPAKDTHRGRLRPEVAMTSENKPLGTKLVLTLKPVKNDQRNERIMEKSFIIDKHPNALSAGAAILHMLKEDPNTERSELVPLFRHPATKREISYKDAAEALKEALKLAGLHNLASGLHCLRIGGISAVCAAKGGGAQIDEVTTRAARQKQVVIDPSRGPLGGDFQRYEEN